MELPQGDQVLAGVKFQIGEGLIHLASKQLPDRPERVEEIPVNTRFSKLYVLHGMGFGPRFGVKDGTNIGNYLVRYEDETTDMIPIIYDNMFAIGGMSTTRNLQLGHSWRGQAVIRLRDCQIRRSAFTSLLGTIPTPTRRSLQLILFRRTRLPPPLSVWPSHWRRRRLN